VLLVVIVGLSACRIDTDVVVNVNTDGTGTVVVTAVADSDVVQAAPDLGSQLRTGDLEESGWQVTGPTPTPDGGIRLQLEHPFSSLAEAEAILVDLAGDEGALRDVQLTAGGERGNTSWTFDGVLDLSSGLAAFADNDLVAAAGGTPWQDVLDERGIVAADAARVAVRVNLPGTVIESSAQGDEPTMWSARPGDAAAALALHTVVADKAAQDARNLERNTFIGLIGYAGLVVCGVGAWLLIRNRRAARRHNALEHTAPRP
jgi:hypothetical protein